MSFICHDYGEKRSDDERCYNDECIYCDTTLLNNANIEEDVKK